MSKPSGHSWLPVWLSGRANETELQKSQRISVPSKAVVFFVRQFVALMRGGVPLVQCLTTLSHQEDYPDFGRVIDIVLGDVSSGHNLSSSLSKFPRVFPKVFVVMVQIGEHTGSLDHCLERLAAWLERDCDLAQRVRSALTYPAFILAVTMVLTLGIFYGVMPSFVSIFEEMRVPLPLVTRLLMYLTHAVRNPLVWMLAIAIFYGLFRLFRKAWENEGSRVYLYGLALEIPILGGILLHGSCSRYCATAEVLLSSGSNMQACLLLAGSVSGSPLLSQDSQAMAKAIADGIQPGEYMSEHPDIYSKTMINFVATGEESSRLPDMFKRASEFHALEMEGLVDAFKASLEPLMLGGVSIMVGTIIFALFLPLYGFLNQIG